RPAAGQPRPPARPRGAGVARRASRHRRPAARAPADPGGDQPGRGVPDDAPARDRRRRGRTVRGPGPVRPGRPARPPGGSGTPGALTRRVALWVSASRGLGVGESRSGCRRVAVRVRASRGVGAGESRRECSRCPGASCAGNARAPAHSHAAMAALPRSCPPQDCLTVWRSSNQLGGGRGGCDDARNARGPRRPGRRGTSGRRVRDGGRDLHGVVRLRRLRVSRGDPRAPVLPEPEPRRVRGGRRRGLHAGARALAARGPRPHPRRHRDRRRRPMSGYEVLAVRYGTRTATKADSFLNFHLYGEPDASFEMDYSFWLVRGQGHTILFDTGFDAEVGRRRGRTTLVDPVAALAGLGVEPDGIDQVVVTHAHYDHIGNLHRFPDAEVVIARREYEFWTGPYANRFQLA